MKPFGGPPWVPKGLDQKSQLSMSAEAVGYSQLISDDEAAAVTTLGLYRQVLSDHIVQYRTG